MPIAPEHKELLSAQTESKTLKEWTEYFDGLYTYKQIEGYVRHNGLKARKMTKEEISALQSKRARKYHINQDYFKTWSRNMAYIFGLWCADGCIYGGKMFDITLHARDKYILQKVKEELGYQGNLYDYVDRQAARLNFSCVVIYNDLVALGGKERKSKDIVFPEVPDEYMPDFVRGFFDGDGSIWNIKGGRVNSSFACASPDFIYPLWDVLKEKAGIKGGSYSRQNISLRFGKKDTILLGKYMYQNDPEIFLKRKRDKFPLE